MPRRWLILASGSLLLLGAVGTLVLFGQDKGAGWTIRLDPSDATLVAAGERIYGEACASCHGDALEGQPGWQNRKADGRLPAPPHDPSGHTWHHPDEILFLLTKHGPAAMVNDPNYPTDMPGFADTLSDREILAVLTYIKSTWPPDIRTRHDAINARSAGG